MSAGDKNHEQPEPQSERGCRNIYAEPRRGHRSHTHSKMDGPPGRSLCPKP